MPTVRPVDAEDVGDEPRGGRLAVDAGDGDDRNRGRSCPGEERVDDRLGDRARRPSHGSRCIRRSGPGVNFRAPRRSAARAAAEMSRATMSIPATSRPTTRAASTACSAVTSDDDRSRRSSHGRAIRPATVSSRTPAMVVPATTKQSVATAVTQSLDHDRESSFAATSKAAATSLAVFRFVAAPRPRLKYLRLNDGQARRSSAAVPSFAGGRRDRPREPARRPT